MKLRIDKHDRLGRNGKAVLGWFDWAVIIVSLVLLACIVEAVICASLLGKVPTSSAVLSGILVMTVSFWPLYRWAFFMPGQEPAIVPFLSR